MQVTPNFSQGTVCAQRSSSFIVGAQPSSSAGLLDLARPAYKLIRSYKFFSLQRQFLFPHLAVDAIIKQRPLMTQPPLPAMMDMIVSGTIKLAHPPISKAKGAPKFMQSGKSSGKIVLTLDSSDSIPVSSLRCSISLICRHYLY